MNKQDKRYFPQLLIIIDILQFFTKLYLWVAGTTGIGMRRIKENQAGSVRQRAGKNAGVSFPFPLIPPFPPPPPPNRVYRSNSPCPPL